MRRHVFKISTMNPDRLPKYKKFGMMNVLVRVPFLDLRTCIHRKHQPNKGTKYT